MRLIDKVKAKDVRSWPGSESDLEVVLSAINYDGCLVFNVDNVASYLASDAGTNYEGRTFEDMAVNLAPVSSVAWFEFRCAPKRVEEAAAHTVGHLILSNALDELIADRGMSPERFSEMYTGLTAEVWSNTRWIHDVYLFVERVSGHVIGPYSRHLLLVDQDGAPLYYTLAQVYAEMSGQVDKAEGKVIFDVAMQHLFTTAFAWSFLHCKNVKRVPREPDAKLAKARKRRNKPPLTRYYTLEIEPMKKILRTEGKSEEVGLKKALHICRGHFAHYTPDRPLFGKVSGRFWIPAHVRGSQEAGEIKKDYRVLSPKEKTEK